MTSRSKNNEFLISVVEAELANLNKEEQMEISRILSEYIQLLDEEKIEAAADLIRSNYGLLVKII